MELLYVWSMIHSVTISHGSAKNRHGTLKMDGFNSCVHGIGSLVQNLKVCEDVWCSSAYISHRSSTCWGTCHLLRYNYCLQLLVHRPPMKLSTFWRPISLPRTVFPPHSFRKCHLWSSWSFWLQGTTLHRSADVIVTYIAHTLPLKHTKGRTSTHLFPLIAEFLVTLRKIHISSTGCSWTNSTVKWLKVPNTPGWLKCI